MNETVKTLNETVWATLAPSKVHGVGVFALRDISKGQKVYAMTEEREWLRNNEWSGLHPAILKVIKQRWPFAFIGIGHPFQSPNSDQRLTSFMNGSTDPNYDFKTDTALKGIKAGEELTESYATMPELYVI